MSISCIAHQKLLVHWQIKTCTHATNALSCFLFALSITINFRVIAENSKYIKDQQSWHTLSLSFSLCPSLPYPWSLFNTFISSRFTWLTLSSVPNHRTVWWHTKKINKANPVNLLRTKHQRQWHWLTFSYYIYWIATNSGLIFCSSLSLLVGQGIYWADDVRCFQILLLYFFCSIDRGGKLQ